MTNSFRNVGLGLLLCLGCMMQAYGQNDIFSIIMERVCTNEWALYPRTSEQEARQWLGQLRADGSFADVDYRDDTRVNWKPLTHLDRLHDMALAYTNPQSTLCGDTALQRGLTEGLRYWYAAHPKSSNWFWQQIGAAQRVGVLLVLMKSRQALPVEVEQLLLARLQEDGGDPAKWTGANKMDIALHWMYQACLWRDEEQLAKSVKELFMPLEVTMKEGLQADFSYHQHGNQLYIGGYGDVFLANLARGAYFLKGTKYALPDGRMDLLRRFATESFIPVLRGQYRLFNVQGRSMTRKGNLFRVDYDLDFVIEQMKQADRADMAPRYEAARLRKTGERPASYRVEPYHRHFWRSAYTLHQRSAYTFDIRMSSPYSLRNENGNEEGLLGYFLSDGATEITTHGAEYADIFPIWNWTRIPGTTAPALDSVPLTRSWGIPGNSPYAGGVTAGHVGVTGYVQADPLPAVGTQAHKGYFLFDDAVVCLGSGIASPQSKPLLTTLNQCWLRGEVLAGTTNKAMQPQPAGQSLELTAPKGWRAWHDGVLYYLPGKSRILLETKTQTGNWYRINHTQSREEVSGEVFTLALCHGTRPQNDTYAYMVAPGVERTQAAGFDFSAYRVLRNDTAVQAVRQGKDGALGILFYQAGTLKDGQTAVTADAPVALWLTGAGTERTLYVADPTHRLTEVNLTVKLPGQKQAGSVHVQLPKPDGPMAGSTVPVRLR